MMQRQFGDRVASMVHKEYRAIDGRIGITDKEDGAYQTISATEARKRLAEVAEDLKIYEQRFRKDGRPIREFLFQLDQVIREAEEQGPPEHQDILDERVRRRPLHVSTSGLILPR